MPLMDLFSDGRIKRHFHPPLSAKKRDYLLERKEGKEQREGEGLLGTKGKLNGGANLCLSQRKLNSAHFLWREIKWIKKKKRGHRHRGLTFLSWRCRRLLWRCGFT